MLEELKALMKSPKLWVTMIGVALIPALYNLSFLGSMWDPYGNVDNLPVAVVNQDKQSTLNNQTLSIGDDMVDSMSKNKALDYLKELAHSGADMEISIRTFNTCARLFAVCENDPDMSDEDVESMIKEQMKNQSLRGGQKF